MIVSASNRGWFPRFFSILGRVGGVGETEEDQTDGGAADSSSEKTTRDAPINAIILSVLLASVYISLGNFRALVTLNGLGEYAFFLLTVVGAIVLRFREPDLHRPYKPLLVIPILFAVVSGFVVIRGATFAPVQALVLLSVWVLGLVYYWGINRWGPGSSGSDI